jgi:hypothetical protein
VSKDIIDILRDDAEYYRGAGRKFMSNSDIGTLLNNPADYGKEQEDCLPFLQGRLFHTAMLEPNKAKAMISKAVDVASRNTKVYKEASADLGGEMLLLTKEVAQVEAMCKKMLGNLDFYDLIRADTNVYEQPAVGMIQDKMFKGKADILADDCVIDLKTTGNINKFKWSARTYGYDSQAYIYQKLFGRPMKFLVIDKTTLELGMYDPSSEFLTQGMDRVEQGLDVWNKFYSPEATHSIDTYYRYDTL